MRVPKKKNLVVSSLIIGLVALVTVITVSVLRNGTEQLVPSDIVTQTPFVIFAPAGRDVIDVNQESIVYNQSSKVLSFTGSSQNPRSKLTFSQQAVPKSNDQNSSFDDRLKSAGPYYEIDTKLDSALLFGSRDRNAKLKTAVVRSQGTVIYVASTVELEADEWTRLIDALEPLPK